MSLSYPYTDAKGGVQLPTWTVGAGGILAQTDPMSAFVYMERKRQVISDSVRQRPLLRLWDKNHNFLGQVAQEQSVSVEELMTDSGGGHLVIRKDNWLSNFILYDRRIHEDIHFTLNPIPTQQSWRTR